MPLAPQGAACRLSAVKKSGPVPERPECSGGNGLKRRDNPPVHAKAGTGRKCTNGAWGVTRKDSAWSQRRACALHFVTGGNSRRRNGLQRSRRLRETTGPQSPCAFRIAFLTAGVTERDAACKPRWGISHTAHRRRGVTAAQRRSFTRYRISLRTLVHVTADPVMPMRTQTGRTVERFPTRYRARRERSCFCYRSASAPSASPSVRSTSAERTVTGVVTTISTSAWTGCAAKPTAATRAASIVAIEHPARMSATSAASRRASVSAQRPQGAEARGIAAEIACRAIPAYSPVAKRRAQSVCAGSRQWSTSGPAPSAIAGRRAGAASLVRVSCAGPLIASRSLIECSRPAGEGWGCWVSEREGETWR